MDARRFVRLLACGRIGIGLALFAAPRTATRLWLGHEVSASTGLLARAMGARDLAIGVGQLATLDDEREVGPWLDAGAVADIADASAVLLARQDLAPRTVGGTALVASGAAAAAVACRWALTGP